MVIQCWQPCQSQPVAPLAHRDRAFSSDSFLARRSLRTVQRSAQVLPARYPRREASVSPSLKVGAFSGAAPRASLSWTSCVRALFFVTLGRIGVFVSLFRVFCSVFEPKRRWCVTQSQQAISVVCVLQRKEVHKTSHVPANLWRELREEVVINFPSLLRQFIKLFVRWFPARGVWRASGCLLFLQANSPFRFVRRRSRSTLAAVRVTGSLGTPTWIAGFLGKTTRENQAAAAKLDAGTGSNPLVERRA